MDRHPREGLSSIIDVVPLDGEPAAPLLTNTLWHGHVLNSRRVTAASEADGLTSRICECPGPLGTRPSPRDGACTFQRAALVVSAWSGWTRECRHDPGELCLWKTIRKLKTHCETSIIIKKEKNLLKIKFSHLLIGADFRSVSGELETRKKNVFLINKWIESSSYRNTTSCPWSSGKQRWEQALRRPWGDPQAITKDGGVWARLIQVHRLHFSGRKRKWRLEK